MVWFVLLLACADDTPVWAVEHASVVPTETGLTGTQTWEFFSSDWSPDQGDQGYLCARAQTVEGTLTRAPGCPACRAAYSLTVTELGGDCASGLLKDPAFAGPDIFAIGDVASNFSADDPYPSQSFGWSVAYGEGDVVDVGYAWPEELESDGEAAPGWTSDRPYTLWPAIAWAL